MKAGVAAAMLATRALALRTDLWRGRLIFSAVVDEEAYSLGARALLGELGPVDACIVTESSFEQPALGSVGKILIRAEVTGKAAHATWPERGVNAAIEAARFVVALEAAGLGPHPRLRASQTVLSLHSGSEQYVVTLPEWATVLINRHTVPGESPEAILERLHTIAAGLRSPARFTFSIEPPFYPPWETAPDHPFVTAFREAYAREIGHAPEFGYTGFGDANLFAGERGIPTVQFGPRGANFHQADEWVDVPSIGAAVRVILRLALAVLR
jgi:acetylornithine deacetylase/succinyl-diaminopimelate desuccinylase-like protein